MKLFKAYVESPLSLGAFPTYQISPNDDLCLSEFPCFQSTPQSLDVIVLWVLLFVCRLFPTVSPVSGGLRASCYYRFVAGPNF